MKKVMLIAATIVMLGVLTSDAIAKAGSSYSGSRSSYSSPKTFLVTNKNVGTKANKIAPTTQYSSTAIQKQQPVVSTPSPSHQAVSPNTAPNNAVNTSKPVYNQPQTQNYQHTNSQPMNNQSPNYGNTHQPSYQPQNSAGMGWVGTATAMGAGVIAGNVIDRALFGNHNQPVYQTAPNGQVYQHSMNNGQVVSTPVNIMPQNVHVIGNDANGQPVYGVQSTQVQPTQQVAQSTSSDFSFFGFIFKVMLYSTLTILVVYGAAKMYRKFVGVRGQNSASNRDVNLPLFVTMFKSIQYGVASSDIKDKQAVAKLCTNEIYDHFYVVKSENAEQGVTNKVEDIEVKDVTTLKYEIDDASGDIYHTVKINSMMRDYTIDTDNNVIDGSKSELTNSIDVWTFVSKDGKTWKLSAIENYVA